MITPAEITAIHDRGETVYRKLTLWAHPSTDARQFFNYELPALVSAARDLAAENQRLRQIADAATAWHNADRALDTLRDQADDDGAKFLVVSETWANAADVLSETIASTRKA